MAEHFLSAEPIHSRWNRDLSPRLRIAPGDTVHMECQDASGLQVGPGMTVAEYQTINRDRIHALTGPIFVEGAEPGDVLEVDILEVAHKGWGWSSMIPGLGFLKERFSTPYLFHWKLEGDVSRSLAPAVVPLRPFCGVMGVAPGESQVNFARGRRVFLAGTWTCAIFAAAHGSICRCSIAGRYFRLATRTPRRATARFVSTASSARRT